MVYRIPLLAFLGALAVADAGRAGVLDPGWSQTVHASDGEFHTGLAWAPDGSDRLFVLEKKGRVRVLSGSTTSDNPTWSTFATLSPIYSDFECGLIGMAFDPNFARNRFVYFFVSESNTTQAIIRYEAWGDVGLGRTVIVPDLPTIGGNHNGGALGFGADGKLYFAVGDLSYGIGSDLDLASLASKVGRVERDGSLPADNPFADGSGPNDDRIFARGFRNPFTMTFQPATGQLWVNVAGSGYEQIFRVAAGDHAGWKNYENNQPAPTATAHYIRPVIAHPGGASGYALAKGTRASNVTTYTTKVPHNLLVGAKIVVSGLINASYNGESYVSAVPSTTQFSAANPGLDGTSVANVGGATVVIGVYGSTVTGGTFYDASLAPGAYRGNFFYPTYNNGRIVRATLDPGTNAVRTTDVWVDGLNAMVDLGPGPDGALYAVGVLSPDILRFAYLPQAQGIVVSHLNLGVDEGGLAVVTVRLAQQPAQPVTVQVARASGDADVSVQDGATLEFDTADWARPKAVRVTAAPDVDKTNDVAVLRFTSTGLASIDTTVRVLDGPVDTRIYQDGFE